MLSGAVIFPEQTSRVHRSAQQTDTQTLQTLSVKIHTLLKSHPSASPAAHAHLNTAYRNLLESLPPSQSAKSAMSAANFAARTDLPRKLANLRHMQHHLSASQLQRPAEFTTNLVADIDSAGRPDPMLKIYLPVDIEWVEFEHALTINTHRRWTYGFSYSSSSSYDDDDSANFPNTYAPRDGGGWIYQRTSSSGQAENTSRPLANPDEFLAMREGQGQGKGDWGAPPLVWPVSLSSLFLFSFITPRFSIDQLLTLIDIGSGL
jgi:hypothetical protein